MSRLLAGQSLVALDTCVWIYHLADHPDYRTLTGQILTGVSQGNCPALVSELTLMELLVRPLQLGREDIADEYETLLAHFPHLSLVPITREILIKAATIRASYRLRTPDAIITASAIIQGATRIITNDSQWKRLEEVDVICLADYL
jgi:predicted nucleic acid-binding protein